MNPDNTADAIKLLSKYDPAWMLVMVAVWIFVWRFNYILSAFLTGFRKRDKRKKNGE